MYSSAFNNFDHLSGSADPKTGTFSFTEKFGTVQADGRFGPKCNLILSYGLLGTLGAKNLTGLGRGWSFKLGNYSRGSNTLTLNTGASHKVLHAPSNGHQWSLSHKVKDLSVKEVDSTIHVHHKNGDKEIMEFDSHKSVAHLSRFISANGRYLEFTYRKFLGYDRLVKVSDKDHTLITVTYNDNEDETIIIIHPGTPDERTAKLYMNPQGLLERIEMAEDHVTSFAYKKFQFSRDKILYPIERVVYSSGASEEMEYDEKLSLPHGAPIPYTPGITKHIKITSTDQPHIITTFKYVKDDSRKPAKNYWGYLAAGVSWENHMDSLFNCRHDYRYSTITKCGDKTTHYECNKFHQEISTIETNGDDSMKTISTKEYYSEGDKVLDDQPDSYELVKKETIKYQSPSGESRDHSKSYEYDEWGNVTVEVDANGVRTISEYYPPEGGEGCPAHPHDMAAYVKHRTYTSSDGALTKSFSYTYQSIPRVGGGTMIVPASKTYGDNMKKTYTYYDSSDPCLQGIQKSEITTINGKATVNSTSYEFPDNNTIRLIQTTKGHDGLSTQSSTTLSRWNGLVKQEKEETGVVTVYTHDALGRTLSSSLAVGTDYEVTTNYQYINNPVDPSTGKVSIGIKIIEETKSGATVHTFHDGEENELSAWQIDKNGDLKKLSEKAYDNQGREVSNIDFDYYTILEGGKSVEKTITKKVTSAYDAWGSKCETTHSDGTTDLSIHDRISDTITHKVVVKDSAGTITNSLASTKTTLGLFGKPTKIEVFDKSGNLYSTTSIDYDQFGRKIKVTRPTGHTAEISKYDDSDRLVEFKHYDGTLLKVSYLSSSIQPLVSSITVPSLNITLGQQEYDGLFRVTSKTVNGAKTEFSYKDGYKQPSRRINGKGQTLLFDHIPELDMQPSHVASFNNDVQIGQWNDASKLSDTKYTYGKPSDHSSSVYGRIMSASSSGGQYTYEYSSGALKKTTQVVGGQSQAIINENSTMEGKPLVVKIGDRKVTHDYSETGETIRTVDGDIMTEVFTDEFGRLTKKVVKQYNPSTGEYDLVQTTDTNYDEHSRETARTIKVEKSGKVISMESSYDVEDKVVERTMTVNGEESITESFSYDSKRRLVDYEVTKHTSDTLLPRNENDKPFSSQAFTFDELDNITSIVTRFPNGNIDTATYHYNQTNKQRLNRISHTLTTGGNAYPCSVSFQYDANGNITSYKDSVMTYTVSGRLATKDGNHYTYDPFDRLVKSNETVHIYSEDHHIVQEINSHDHSTTDIIRYGAIPVGEVRSDGHNKIYGVDQSFTTVAVTEGTSTTALTYSPYGSGYNGARVGLNGQLRDISDNNVYHLGNGTRTYWPAFNGFSTADTYSPFLGGGINPYKYCTGDPINAVDPSGHMGFWKIFGLAAAAFVAVVALVAVPFTAGSSLGLAIGIVGGICGVVSAGCNIAAEVYADQGNTKMAKTLSTVSLAFGIAGAALSLGQVAADIGAIAKAGMAAAGSKISSRVMRRTFNMAKKDMDDFVTTGFKTRYAVSKNPHILSSEKNIFGVAKFSKGKLTGLKSTRPKIAEKQFGRFYVRTVREPIRVFRGGNYAGMTNILSKGQCFGRMIASGLQISQISSRVDSLINKINEDDDDDDDGGLVPLIPKGSERGVSANINSAFDLPNVFSADTEKLFL